MTMLSESLWVWKFTSVYLKEGESKPDYQSDRLKRERYSVGVDKWVQMKASSIDCVWAVLLWLTYKKKIQVPASLSKTQTTLQCNMHKSCWSNLLWRRRENVQSKKQIINYVQCWPTPSGWLLCKAAAHGSSPLREKWFRLWEPLRLWAAEQINTTQNPMWIS